MQRREGLRARSESRERGRGRPASSGNMGGRQEVGVQPFLNRRARLAEDAPARHASKSGLMNKHIVKHVCF